MHGVGVSNEGTIASAVHSETTCRIGELKRVEGTSGNFTED
jgi:hypothetical protein